MTVGKMATQTADKLDLSLVVTTVESTEPPMVVSMVDSMVAVLDMTSAAVTAHLRAVNSAAKTAER